ncbi:MAG: hypothetical protein AB1714_22205 [Acidobacteriota bacterium]
MILDEAREDESKVIASLKKKLATGISWTSGRSVEDASTFAYLLHALGRDGEAVEVCSYLAEGQPGDSLERSVELGDS